MFCFRIITCVIIILMPYPYSSHKSQRQCLTFFGITTVRYFLLSHFQLTTTNVKNLCQYQFLQILQALETSQYRKPSFHLKICSCHMLLVQRVHNSSDTLKCSNNKCFGKQTTRVFHPSGY